jgi:DNA-binding winged helix-turn-helix (wHTH) protein/tetratricopeptide (TPR) repeat protein
VANAELTRSASPFPGFIRAQSMSHAAFQFGEFIIDPAARELWQGSERIALPPKSFDCLAYLLEHRERAVGRDELISAVWGRVDVSDAVLAQTLLRARRAVGDTGTEQTTIRTILRFGYRWIAPVQIVESQTPAMSQRAEPMPALEDLPVASPEPADAVTDVVATIPAPPAAEDKEFARVAVDAALPPPLSGSRSPWIVAALTVAAVVAGALLWHKRQPTRPPESAVVVMPVNVTETEPEYSWIRLGGMDYIAARLREEGKLAVLPSSQIVALIGDLAGDAALDRVAKATGAKWLVQPLAQRTAKGWQVQLVVKGDGATHEAIANAVMPLAAAEQASERLLSELNIPHKEHASNAATPTPLTELVQRVDAALLAGDMTEARRLIDGSSAAQRAEPALRVREGQLAFRLGHVDEAEHMFAPIAASPTPMPVDVQAPAMMGLGAVAVRHGDFPTAEKHYAEALAALGNNGDPNLVGNAYTGRGVARAAQQHFDVALGDFGRARVALEHAGNELDAAAVDVNLGITENTRKRFAQAIPYFDRALAVHERFGVRDNVAVDLLGKANAQLEQLATVDSLATSSRAFELAAQLENHILVRAIYLQHVRVLLAVGRLHDAEQVLAKLPAGLGNDDAQAANLGARLALARGENEKALNLLLPMFTASSKPEISLLPAFADAAAGAGQLGPARKALDAIKDAGNDDRAALELARARLAVADNKMADAETHYAAALSAADQEGVPLDRAQAGAAYAAFLVSQHQLDKAGAVIGDLAVYVDKDFDAAQATVAFYRASGDSNLEAAARAKAKPIVGERNLGS